MAQVPSNLIPTRVTQLMNDPAPSANGVMMYVRDGVNYQVRVGDLLNVTGVPTTRQVSAGTGLTGGGSLSEDITLSVAPKGIGISQLDDTGVTPGSYGSSGYAPVITVDSTGRITTVAQAPITSSSGGTVKSIDVSGGTTGLTTSGGPVIGEGTVTLAGTLVVSSGGTGATTAPDARANLSAAVLGTNNDITSMTGVTGGISSPDFLQFDVTPATTGGVGSLTWNDGDGTLDLRVKGGNVTLQIGQEELQRSFNEDVAEVVDGNVVYTSGAQGNRISVKRAQANAKATSTGTIGMATEHLAVGAEGFITTQGLVRQLNTLLDSEGNSLTEGDLLYLSATVVGGYTRIEPVAPMYRVFIGYVVRVHASVGSIYIRPNVFPELGDVNFVRLTSVADTNLLQYDGALSVWKNVLPSAVTAGRATALAGGAASQLAYQTAANTTGFVPNGTTGQILKSAGAAVPAWTTAGALTKTDDTNVTLTLGGSASTALVNAASLTLGWTGTLAAARGGTGQSTYTVGDLLYASTTSALSKLAAGSAGQVLTSAGASAPAWGGLSGGTF